MEGIGSGVGAAAGAEAGAGVAAGVLLVDVELGAACGSEEVVCPTDGNAASTTKKTARELSDVMRKVDLLFKSLFLIQLDSSTDVELFTKFVVAPPTMHRD